MNKPKAGEMDKPDRLHTEMRHRAKHNRIRYIAFLQPSRDGKTIPFIDHVAEWEIKYKTAMDEAAKKLWPDAYDQT